MEIEEKPYIQQLQHRIKEAEEVVKAIYKMPKYVQPTYLVEMAKLYANNYNKELKWDTTKQIFSELKKK